MTNKVGDHASAWGYELVIDCWRGNDNVSNQQAIKTFAKDLVAAIDMVAYGEPQVVHFGTGHLAGWTLVQLIETSSITAHFCDDGTAYLNIFSCKPFEEETATTVIQKHFAFQSIFSSFNVRDAKSNLLRTPN